MRQQSKHCKSSVNIDSKAKAKTSRKQSQSNSVLLISGEPTPSSWFPCLGNYAPEYKPSDRKSTHDNSQTRSPDRVFFRDLHVAYRPISGGTFIGNINSELTTSSWQDKSELTLTGNLGSCCSPRLSDGQPLGMTVDVDVLKDCLIAFFSRFTPFARSLTWRLISLAIFIIQTITAKETTLDLLHTMWQRKHAQNIKRTEELINEAGNPCKLYKQ